MNRFRQKNNNTKCKEESMKKILVISMVLALALALVLPSVALAAGPNIAVFKTAGYINPVGGIDVGKVKELGKSGTWLVDDRHIWGQFTSGSLTGPFTLTYDGIFALATQEGNLHGILKMDKSGETFEINGKVAPLKMVTTPYGALPELDIAGHWTYLKGGKGAGDFSAKIDFIPDAAGHVGSIPFSTFEMTGKNIVRDRDNDRNNDRDNDHNNHNGH
jgi:hypothetical protein